ncbi:DUF1844 domain-containing protein [Hippea jasoniae]|uniref:DUF1844 domain-containing protein n=1 Tax=Hippea jasoniae TaxID=944479 RepID=UPI00068A86C3|nr:DUF1844 domain-containing protein [Hippea jasoniae]
MKEPEFADIVISLAQSAYVYLGVVEDPFSKQTIIDLKQARYAIDLIEVLKDKTKGNLNEEEQRLLDEILYDLRVKYLEKTSK